MVFLGSIARRFFALAPVSVAPLGGNATTEGTIGVIVTPDACWIVVPSIAATVLVVPRSMPIVLISVLCYRRPGRRRGGGSARGVVAASRRTPSHRSSGPRRRRRAP